ncbi:MAG TPA: DUF1345 domain-containing protein [Gaiellaceae bacterium]|nr:DUF1345 domain-containing protein [Gaiellaceae bacterium]
MPNRQGLAARRGVAGAVLGAITLGISLVGGASVPVALTIAWGASALLIAGWAWASILPMNAEETKTHAKAEDSSRVITDLILLVTSVASLGGVGYTVHAAGRHQGGAKALLIGLAVVVVASSWLLVHTLYTIKYGDHYYDEPIGGVDWNDDDRPDYHDFAYLALTIGMTFQVSDTSLQSKPMRRLAIRHALLSFLFVAVIGALLINSVASLLQ